MQARPDRQGRLPAPARRAADRARARRRGDRPRRAPARSRSTRSSSRPTWCRPPRWPGGCSAEAGELRRKARRIIEKAWTANPHPDLAETYAHLRPGDSARERLARVQTLALTGRRANVEGALAVARAALDAQEFAVARDALAPLLRGADAARRRADGGDRAARAAATRAAPANGWRARCAPPRDPAWTADGFVSDRWMPVSPVSGRLDAFQWKVPLAELGVSRPVIEMAPTAARRRASRSRRPPAPSRRAGAAPAKPAARRANPPAATVQRRRQRPKPVEPVIPLVHAPDDPGPESGSTAIRCRNPSRRAARERLAALQVSCSGSAWQASAYLPSRARADSSGPTFRPVPA